MVFFSSIDVPGCRGVSHTPSRRHRWWRIHVLRSSPWRGRWGGRMLLRPYPFGRKTGTAEVGRLPLGVCRCNRLLASVPLTGTSVGAYAIRPYPFGRKKGTLKRYGFKKQSCFFDCQGRGVLHTPSESGMMGLGRLPLDVCRRNRVRTFVPLAGTSGRAYAFVPLPIRTKKGNPEKIWVQKTIRYNRPSG